MIKNSYNKNGTDIIIVVEKQPQEWKAAQFKTKRLSKDKELNSEAFLKMAFDAILPDLLLEAEQELDQNFIENVFSDNVFDIIQMNEQELIVEFNFMVIPEIILPDYENLEIPFETINVNSELVNKHINDFARKDAVRKRKLHNELVAYNDIVTATLKFYDDQKNEIKPMFKENYEILIEEKDSPYVFDVGQLIGLKINDTTLLPFKIEESEDGFEPEVTLKVQIKINKIEKEILPEINDEWVLEQDLPKEIKTLKDLQLKIKEDLLLNSHKEATKNFLDKIFDHLISQTDDDISEILIEQQFQKIKEYHIQDLKDNNWEIENWLKKEFMTMDEWEAQLWEEAIYRIKRTLIIENIFGELEIAFSDDEYQSKIKEISKAYRVPISEIKKDFNYEDVKRIFKEDIVNETLINANKK